MTGWLALRLIRVRYNLSQAEMAERVGVKYTSIGDLESGKVSLNLEHIAAYAKFLGTSQAVLVDFIEQLSDPKCIFPGMMGNKPPKVSEDSTTRLKAVKVAQKKKSNYSPEVN
jgi:transcriptional regulator with XRE-family HTH domain